MFPSIPTGLDAPLNGLKPLELTNTNKNQAEAPVEKAKPSDSFGNIINLVSRGINSVNERQINAENSIEDLVTGNGNNLHDVVVAIQEANISFQFAVKARNKMVEAYQEVMRMQI